MASLTLPMLLLSGPGVASAQTVSSTSAPVRLSEVKLSVKLVPADVRRSSPLFQPTERRDSLTNGTVIGALVGAAVLGVTSAAVCKVYQEPTDPSCVGHAFKVAALGAAIGAGTGLAIDAALSRQGGVRVAVKKRF